MPGVVQCPHCGATLRYKTPTPPRAAKCPKCGQPVEVAPPEVDEIHRESPRSNAVEPPAARIAVTCWKCGKNLNAPESMLGKKVKCPACAAQVPVKPLDPDTEARERFLAGASPRARAASEEQARKDQSRRVQAEVAATPLDLRTKVGFGAGLACLLLLALSPFLYWVKIFTGGMLGISGDGKVVLVLSVATGAFAALGYFRRRFFTPGILVAGAWGTVASLWMASLVYTVSSLGPDLAQEDTLEAAFAVMFASQIGPGSGLYLGFLSGLGVIGAFVYLATLDTSEGPFLRRYRVLLRTQAIAVVVAILIVFLHANPRTGEAASEMTITPEIAAEGVAFVVKNTDTFDWTDLSFYVSLAQRQGSAPHALPRLPAGESCRLNCAELYGALSLDEMDHIWGAHMKIVTEQGSWAGQVAAGDPLGDFLETAVSRARGMDQTMNSNSEEARGMQEGFGVMDRKTGEVRISRIESP